MKNIKLKNKILKNKSVMTIGIVLIAIIGVVFMISIMKGMQRKKNQEAANMKNQIVQQETTGNLNQTTALESDSREESTEEETTEEETSEEETIEEETEEEITETQEEQKTQAPVQETEPPIQETEATQPQVDFVTNLQVATTTSQLIIVSASGSTAQVSMHQKGADGTWTEIFSVAGYVGSNGVGQASESSSFTPRGIYSLSQAFGNNPNPGCPMGYTQIDDSHYWVDDVNSPLYNQFISTNTTPLPEGTSAEHLSDYPTQYAYAVNIDYNRNPITPGAGSAFFLHCSNGLATAGCVAIPQSAMVTVLTCLQSDCRIVIDTAGNIMNN